MSAPLVSVIIPCRNASPTLAGCVASCLDQTYPRIELILADNDSSDDSVAVFERVTSGSGRPCVVTGCTTPGVNHARNQGYASARGDYVQWLDADDTLGRGKIAAQVQALETRREFAIAYADWRWNFHLEAKDAATRFARLRGRVLAAAYGNRDWTLGAGPRPVATLRFDLGQHDDYLSRLLEDKWIPPHAYLVRRPAADRLQERQAWHPSNPFANDREYFTSAALLGCRFLHVEGASVDYNAWSPGQLTARASPLDRARSIKAMALRLFDLAASHAARWLTRDHRILLNQDRDVWRAAPAIPAEALAGDEVATRVAGALATRPADSTLEWLAKIVAHRVPELWERHTLVMGALERLCVEGHLRKSRVL